MNEFFSWENLGTYAGAVVATSIITQFIKPYTGNLPTQLLSWVISIVVLGAATVATGMDGWQEIAIIPFNAILISLASNGVYSAVTRNEDLEAEDDPDDEPDESDLMVNPTTRENLAETIEGAEPEPDDVDTSDLDEDGNPVGEVK